MKPRTGSGKASLPTRRKVASNGTPHLNFPQHCLRHIYFRTVGSLPVQSHHPIRQTIWDTAAERLCIRYCSIWMYSIECKCWC